MSDEESTKKNVRARMSMRDKLVDKQKTNQEHTRNWGAGRVAIHERYLHRTGVRGRKRYLLFAVLLVLALICLINLIILCIALSRLMIDSTGMEHLSFFDNGMLRWMNGGDLKHIWLQDGEVKTYKNMDLRFEGNNERVMFYSGSLARLAVGKDEVSVQAKCFKFIVPGIEKTVLNICDKEVTIEGSTNTSQDFDELITPRVTSKFTDDLNIIAGTSAVIQGNEGVNVDTQNLKFDIGRTNPNDPDQGNITIASKLDSIININGLNGVTMLGQLPDTSSGIIQTRERYKLCACANGMLFKIKVDGAQKVCADLDGTCA